MLVIVPQPRLLKTCAYCGYETLMLNSHVSEFIPHTLTKLELKHFYLNTRFLKKSKPKNYLIYIL